MWQVGWQALGHTGDPGPSDRPALRVGRAHFSGVSDTAHNDNHTNISKMLATSTSTLTDMAADVCYT
jgi:hypothetical protein